MRIHIKKGLDIPLSGGPSGEVGFLPKPSQVALSLSTFDEVGFRLLVKLGEKVKIGQPLVENKNIPGQFFASPACGTIAAIHRGLKRRLESIVIDLDEVETDFENAPLNIQTASREEIIDYLLKGGLFPHIRMRPFDLIADPRRLPRDIFIKALESAPYVPPAELQVKGFEEAFEVGLNVLKKLTTGGVHLIYREGTSCEAFKKAPVNTYPASGPHPIANPSLHIHRIRPIDNAEDVCWTLSTTDVIAIGRVVGEGKYHTHRVIGIAGNGVISGKQGFFVARSGYLVDDLSEGRLIDQKVRLISGDPLMGTEVMIGQFLGFYDTLLSVIPENTTREFLHFARLGKQKYSALKAYYTGHRKPPREGYDFTTSQHGEERAFIDGVIYDQVMPMRIPTMEIVKAVLGEDFDLAERLGLLEVAPEDFALPSFICPSKIEMVDIIKNGLRRYAKDMGY